MKHPICFHFRSNRQTRPHEDPDISRGGVTVVFNPDTKRFGYAVCQNIDNFNRKKGYAVALGRSKSSEWGEPIHDIKNVDNKEAIRLQAIGLAKSAVTSFNRHISNQAERFTEKMYKKFALQVSFDRK